MLLSISSNGQWPYTVRCNDSTAAPQLPYVGLPHCRCLQLPHRRVYGCCCRVCGCRAAAPVTANLQPSGCRCRVLGCHAINVCGCRRPPLRLLHCRADLMSLPPLRLPRCRCLQLPRCLPAGVSLRCCGLPRCPCLRLLRHYCLWLPRCRLCFCRAAVYAAAALPLPRLPGCRLCFCCAGV